MIEFKGQQVEIMALSDKYGVPWSTIKNRYLAGYRDDMLIAERIHDTQFMGEPSTLKKIADDSGLPLSLIKGRHAIGLRDKDLIAPHHLGKGSENAATKLNPQKVKEIKTILWTTDLTQKDIADMYGIDQSHVSDIKRGHRWAKVVVDLAEILNQNDESSFNSQAGR